MPKFFSYIRVHVSQRQTSNHKIALIVAMIMDMGDPSDLSPTCDHIRLFFLVYKNFSRTVA